ncbi:MAG: hypothetical protein AAFX52_11110 [Pseudomonadota bacterium]
MRSKPQRFGRALSIAGASIQDASPMQGGNLARTLSRFDSMDERERLREERLKQRERMDDILGRIKDPEMRQLAELDPQGYARGRLRSLQGGGQPDVFSTFQGNDGKMYTVDRSGKIRDTGVGYRTPSNVFKIGDVAYRLGPDGQTLVPVDPGVAGALQEDYQAGADAYGRGVKERELGQTDRRLDLQDRQDAREEQSAERELTGLYAKAQGSLSSARVKAETVKTNVTKAIEQSGPFNTGAVFGRLGLTNNQVDLGGMLETLGVNSFTEALQEMRDNSPTGGAVGSVTDAERKALSALRANLSRAQSEEQLDQALRDVSTFFEGSLARIEAAMADDVAAGRYGDAPARRRANADNIPPGAISKLQADPSLAAAFDQKYGPGAAERVLGP